MIQNLEILLASQSPRRAEILKNSGCVFKVIEMHCDESYNPALPIHKIAKYIACKKMLSCDIELQSNQVLITADTIVVLDGVVFGKPTSTKQAKEMLHKLSNNKHEVMTGVCIRTKNKKMAFTCKSTVYFTVLNEDIINFYIHNFNVMDKAGAYGIQEGIGLYAVKKIKGCYFNIMGLPMNKILQKLDKI